MFSTLDKARSTGMLLPWFCFFYKWTCIHVSFLEKFLEFHIIANVDTWRK